MKTKVLIILLIMKIWILKLPLMDVHIYLCINHVNLYPFLFFFSSKNEWLCIVCSEYGEGDEFWRTKGVKQGEHPNRTFFTHEKSKKHTKAVSKRAEVKRFFSKRSIYKQIYQGAETENQKT